MISHLVEKCWDVIVIGTGMGGGTIGRRLSEQGLSVLFLEQGPTSPSGGRRGFVGEARDPTARLRRGYWPVPIPAQVQGRKREILDTIGAGVGGTSALYAAALERPEPHDLDDSAERPHPTGGWPVSYAEFRPYYEQAERMYCVSGDGNPLAGDEPAFLRTPPVLPKGDAALMESFRRRGLHPYRMHLGVRDVSGCQECFGRICARTCKMDGRTAGVEPALLTGRAALLGSCQVVALRGTPSRVTHVEAVCAGQPLTFQARRFVLAAGALGSPRLLLGSASEAWPRGCANESGLVGRNLMFHLSELIAIWPERVVDFKGFSRTIALRDLYYVNGRRFGLIQSLGLSASFGEILHVLNERFERTSLRRARALRQLNRIPAMAAAKVFGEARVFTGILEDLPYAENRVFLENGDMSSMRVKYHFPSELLERRELFRDAMKKSLKGLKSFFMNMEPELNFGHPCGTLRFGEDPVRSVLDTSCRAHSVRNLYAVDTSFMPTSTGVNPSLTTAANALRVADRILTERS